VWVRFINLLFGTGVQHQHGKAYSLWGLGLSIGLAIAIVVPFPLMQSESILSLLTGSEGDIGNAANVATVNSILALWIPYGEPQNYIYAVIYITISISVLFLMARESDAKQNRNATLWRQYDYRQVLELRNRISALVAKVANAKMQNDANKEMMLSLNEESLGMMQQSLFGAAQQISDTPKSGEQASQSPGGSDTDINIVGLASAEAEMDIKLQTQFLSVLLCLRCALLALVCYNSHNTELEGTNAQLLLVAVLLSEGQGFSTFLLFGLNEDILDRWKRAIASIPGLHNAVGYIPAAPHKSSIARHPLTAAQIEYLESQVEIVQEVVQSEHEQASCIAYYDPNKPMSRH